MPLLGKSLVVLLVLVIVGLLALTLWLWNRFGGPRPLRVAGRLLMVGLCQVSAILLVAALANDYGYFYGSWSDLLGGGTVQESVTRVLTQVPPGTPGAKGATAASGATRGAVPPAGVTMLPDPGWAPAGVRQTRGQLQSATIRGVSSQLSSHAFIYLPPQYFQAKYAHYRFPAAEVFTGFPGNDLGLVRGLKYPDRLLGEIAVHRAHPMVLVMVRPSVTYPRDTECTDVPGGPQALTFFATDVPEAIERQLRVLPRAWGAIGDSTGGYCAAKLAMTHPYTFPAAVALSGYFHTLKDSTTGDLWAGSAQVRHLNDLEWLLKHQPAPATSLLVTSSKDEGGANGYVDTARFVSLVRPPMTVDQLILPHGGHNYTTWKIELPRSMSWLSQHLPAARA